MAPFGVHDYPARTGFIRDALSDCRAAGQVDNMVLYPLNDYRRKAMRWVHTWHVGLNTETNGT